MAVEMQDVMQAAVDAQRAGDTQKAQQYKALYQKYSQPQQFAQAGPEVIEPNFGKLFDDGPIDYSIDNAQKLYGAAAETVGRATGVDSLESYGQNVQAQQDVDIQKGNYQSAHPDDFIDIWKNKGLTGVLSALPTKMAENVTTTGAALIGAGVITAASAMGAPASLLIALKALSGANLVALGVGEVTQEQKEKLGDFDPALSLGGGAIIAFLERIGAGGVIPKSKLVGMTAPQITAALAKAGKTSAVKKFATAMASEGLTESAQELVAIGSAAAQGADYTGREVAGRLVDSGVLGAAYGGTFNAAGQTAGAVGAGVNRAGTALANMDSLKVTDEEAASTFAKRLETIATANKWDLTDIDRMSTTGARHILDQAHVQLSTALVHKFNDVADKVKASDRDSIQEVEDKIMAAAGYRQGKNKTKNTVGVQEYAAFEKLAGDTLEGQEALALMRELDQLTVLHNAGYQAGLSRITDQLAPFGSSVGYDKGAINSERLLRPIVSGQAALMSGGLTLAAQSALWGAGRLADKATGNRSRIATYVDTYKSKPGIAKAKGFSVRKAAQAEAVATEQEQLRAEERAAQTAADKDAANRDLNQRDSEPTPTSPQDTVQRGTGLSKQKVAKMLRILKNDQNLLPFYQKLINEYETSVDTGGKISDFLLIRRINTLVDSNVTLRADRTNPPDRGVIAEAGGTYIEKFVSNYERGRADNIRVVNELRDQLNADTTLSNVDKAVLLNTVDKLLLNLGSDPVGRIGSLMKRLQIQGVPDAAIQKYVGPYFERVASQQAAKADKDAAVLEVKEAVERPDAAPAPAPVAPQAQVAPQAPAPVLALPGLPAPEVATEGGVLAETAPETTGTLTSKGTILAEKAGEKFEDFGEVLTGARKHTYTFRESLSDDIDSTAVPLSKSFPQPDYQQLVDAGIPAETLALVAYLRSALPSKPRKGYKLKRWADQVDSARAFASELLSGDVSVTSFEQAIKEAGPMLREMADVFKLAREVLPSQIKDLGQYRLERSVFSLYGDETNVAKWVVSRTGKSTGGSNFRGENHFDTKEEALVYIKSQATTLDSANKPLVKFDVWSETGVPGYTVGKKVAAGKYIPLASFDNTKDARAYIASNNSELVALLAQKKKIGAHRRAEQNERVGKDYRSGKNVTSDLFNETFGFRGVQFGNWVENDRRQQDVNNAYDGLLDLADVLGIPPRAISLNGALGLAFGARGKGASGASAHFEPGNVVINLTKKTGAGSLAHEWWHATDNYFAKMGELEAKNGGAYLTELDRPKRGYVDQKYTTLDPAAFGVRPEVYDAFKKVVATIKGDTGVLARSEALDQRKTKNYWTTEREMTARSFERYVIDKLAADGYESDYLANIMGQEAWDAHEAAMGNKGETYPYPTDAEAAATFKAYDELFKAIKTEETDAGVMMYSKSAFLSPTDSPKGVPLDAAQRAVKAFMKTYKGADDGLAIQLHKHQDDLLGQNSHLWIGKATAASDADENALHLFLNNINSVTGLREVLQHEVIVHKGLGLFTDAQQQEILGAIAENASKSKSLAPLWADIQKNYAELDSQGQAEELLARVAETKLSTADKYWNKIVTAIRNALVRLGLISKGISKNDLKNTIYQMSDSFREGREATSPRRPPNVDESQIAPGNTRSLGEIAQGILNGTESNGVLEQRTN